MTIYDTTDYCALLRKKDETIFNIMLEEKEQELRNNKIEVLKGKHITMNEYCIQKYNKEFDSLDYQTKMKKRNEILSSI